MSMVAVKWSDFSDSQLTSDINLNQRLLEVVSSAAPSLNINLLKILYTGRLTFLRSEQARRSTETSDDTL